MSFIVGETVGPYRITEQLGSGGMATVFKAYHAALDRYVAIKVLHPAFKEDPSFLGRFQREARVVAKLEHPNIVPVYDFSDHNGQPYLVMRYIEGETLKARLGHGPLSIDEMLKVVHSVGAALIYAHGQGVLHRDIKPSNVMLTPKGDVFLTDFGLARIAQAGESTLSQDSILGTPQYISPEQAKAERDLDARTDIYSLGVVIYELLVGRVPYQADTPFAVVHDHIFTPLPMPRTINPNLPEPFERFLLKALAKDRADRFPMVEEMMTALNRAVDESGIKLASSPSTILTTPAAPTVAAAPKPAAPTVAVHAPARKPISPLIWIGLSGLIVVVIVGILLATRSPIETNPPPVEATKPPQAGPEVKELRDNAASLFRKANDLVLEARPRDARATFRDAAQTAEDALQRAPADAPEAQELRLLAAEAWLAGGEPARADAHLKWLSEKQPDNPFIYTGIGASLLLQNRIDEALAATEKALGLQPDFAPAHAVKGCAHLKKGEPLIASREFRQAKANSEGLSAIPPWIALVMTDLDCRLDR